MPSLPLSLPLTSNGPERFHGGSHCVDHHAGVRTGFPDWCCCCDPCLYERPPEGTQNSFCHRCAPQLICAVFTPDGGSASCCGVIRQPIVPTYSFSPPTMTYLFSLGVQGTWQLGTDVYGLTCFWRLQIAVLSIDVTYEIDHVTTTSLALPSVVVTGVVVPGAAADCAGTLSFVEYDSAKIPFINNEYGELDTIDIDYDIAYPSPCNCTTAARILCVSGVRNTGGVNESVTFGWNTTLGDRWEYVPPCTDPATTREVIYLRSDSYGDCYLELDFKRTGSDTNDWAVPPNTFDLDYPHEIRDGMIEINNCGCNLYVPTLYSSDLSKHITIHAGPCAGWKYVCGTCRCVPRYLCVIGQIDGAFVSETAVWEEVYDGFGWTMGNARFLLGEGTCTGNFPGVEGCAIHYDGDAVTQFDPANGVTCGKFINAELYPTYDPDNSLPGNASADWIWLSSSTCGSCGPTTCGPCTEERCGGPPQELLVELFATGNPPVDPEIDPPQYPDCDLSLTVYYWQRWDTTGPPVMTCGYVGFSGIQDCGGGHWFQIRCVIYDNGATLALARRDSDHTISGVPYWYGGPFAGDLPIPPSTCDPFLFDTGWVPDPTTACFWGCGLKDNYRVIVSE